MYRHLPQSNTTRLYALNSVDLKISTIINPSEIFTADVIPRLKSILPKFKGLYSEYIFAYAEYCLTTSDESKSKKQLRLLVRHFIRVFNMGVARGLFPISERKNFGLDISNNRVPDTSTERMLSNQAERIISGEKMRLMHEGAIPMAMPSAKEIEDAYTHFDAKTGAQIAANGLFIKSQGNLADILPEVDELIRDIWDMVEFFYRKEPAAHKRRLAREYGVVYLSRKKKEEEVDIEESVIVLN